MRDEKSFQTRNETAGILEVFQGCVTQAGAIYRPQTIHELVSGAINASGLCEHLGHRADSGSDICALCLYGHRIATAYAQGSYTDCTAQQCFAPIAFQGDSRVGIAVRYAAEGKNCSCMHDDPFRHNQTACGSHRYTALR
jgi:hypothetical protein